MKQGDKDVTSTEIKWNILKHVLTLSTHSFYSLSLFLYSSLSNFSQIPHYTLSTSHFTFLHFHYLPSISTFLIHLISVFIFYFHNLLLFLLSHSMFSFHFFLYDCINLYFLSPYLHSISSLHFPQFIFTVYFHLHFFNPCNLRIYLLLSLLLVLRSHLLSHYIILFLLSNSIDLYFLSPHLPQSILSLHTYRFTFLLYFLITSSLFTF